VHRYKAVVALLHHVVVVVKLAISFLLYIGCFTAQCCHDIF